MTDRKKPTTGFWITVALVAALVGYPLSFGPACWISSHANAATAAVPILYAPLIWVLSEQRAVLDWYSQIGAPDGWMLCDYGDRWVWQQVWRHLRAP